MLCQLVCVDRRYQRMNCFNIRELQGILKRKFFTDLVNTSDSHKAMESTLINMRYKNNSSNILLYDQSLFYNFDLTNTSKFKNFNFTPGKIYTYTSLNFFSQKLPLTQLFFLNNYYNIFPTLLKDFISFIYIPQIITLSTLVQSLKHLHQSLINTLYINLPNNLTNSFLSTFTTNNNINVQNQNINSSYKSSTTTYSNFDKLSSLSFSENSSS
jgi:hypothetical protein